MFRTLVFFGVISSLTSCRVTGNSNEAMQAASRNSNKNANSTVSNIDPVVTNSSSTQGYSPEKDLSTIVSNSGSGATQGISNERVVNINASSGLSNERVVNAQVSKNPNTIGGYKSEDVGLSQSAASSNNLEYRIQLGVFKNLNASAKYRVPNVSRKIVDDKLVYEISGFLSASEANNYAISLRKKKKLNGAFVTKYVDGQRDYNYDFNRDYSVRDNSTGIRNENAVVPVEIVKSAPNKRGTIEVISPSNAAKKKASIVLEE